MRIKMRTLAAGPCGVFQPGKEYTVPNNVGHPMVDGGYAYIVGTKPVAKIMATEPKAEPVEEPKVEPPKVRRGRQRSR